MRLKKINKGNFDLKTFRIKDFHLDYLKKFGFEMEELHDGQYNFYLT
jgi:hypothetical protein